MFERFTDQARGCIVHAQDEAREHNHSYIGTEHFLLALIRDEESSAARVLTGLGADLGQLRTATDAIIGHAAREVSGHIPFTPRAKLVLEMSLREALQLGHNHIGTEHLLLGLLREGDGVGAKVLVHHGLTHSRVRIRVARLAGAESENEPYPLVSSEEVYDADDLSARLGAILDRLGRIERRLRASETG
jgi:ATP-dependent Clp protease ATP-binding subunit ClpC